MHENQAEDLMGMGCRLHCIEALSFLHFLMAVFDYLEFMGF